MCVCACISPHSVLIVRNVKRRLISLLTNEIQSAHPHAHYEVFVCVCVCVRTCALNLDSLRSRRWSTANHSAASQWTALMHLTTPEGAAAWQRRTASLPAVTPSLPYFPFFLQPLSRHCLWLLSCLICSYSFIYIFHFHKCVFLADRLISSQRPSRLFVCSLPPLTLWVWI